MRSGDCVVSAMKSRDLSAFLSGTLLACAGAWRRQETSPHSPSGGTMARVEHARPKEAMKTNAGRALSRVLNIQRTRRSQPSANGALSLHSRGGARLRVRQTGQSLLVVSLGIFLATL